MGRRSLITTIIATVIFLGGIGVMLYPPLASFINERSQTTVISNYEDAVLALSGDDREAAARAAVSYNESLAQNQGAIIDPFNNLSTEETPQEVSFLKVGEVMGYLQIPEIGIKTPVYEGTSEDVLQKGIGWLKGTSLPTGGVSTNSVLTGHRGLPTAKLFTDIDLLEPGDEFFLRNSMEILAYRVIEKKVIDPEDTEALAIEEGEDRMTLLTCHPYMVNSHRLLVIGERIPYTGQLEEAPSSGNPLDAMTSAEKDLTLWGLVALAAVVLLVLVIVKPWRRRKVKSGNE